MNNLQVCEYNNPACPCKPSYKEPVKSTKTKMFSEVKMVNYQETKFAIRNWIFSKVEVVKIYKDIYVFWD